MVSQLHKSKPHRAVVAWLEPLDDEQIFISSVTMGELQAGVELMRRQDAGKANEIESWLAVVERSFSSLDMDTTCFREWARLMARKPEVLRDDAMIAATARVRGLAVATRNEKDFRQLDAEVFNPFKYRRPS